MRTKAITTLEYYKNTGFSPEQVLKMYENLTNTADIFLRLLSNDVEIMTLAYDDAKAWVDGYLSYCKKEELH